MTIKFTKETLEILEENGISIAGYIFILSLSENEDVFPVDEKKWYLLAEKLIIDGFISMNFEETDEMYILLKKGEDLIETIKNQ